MRGTFVERVAGSRAHGNVDRHQPRAGSVATSEAGRERTVCFLGCFTAKRTLILAGMNIIPKNFDP